MKNVTSIASILAPLVVVSMLAASDVQGGAAVTPAGKTTGPAQTATIVIDLTGTTPDTFKGGTSMRVQRSGSNSGAFFMMNVIPQVPCETVLAEIQSRFEGWLIDWFVPSAVRSALFGTSGDAAAITDTDYASCTTVGSRTFLSFTAVIQFKQK
jgi:hypothetical protein